MNKTDLNITLKRASWLLVLVFSIAIIFSAVERRESSRVQGMDIHIKALDGENSLIKPQDIQLTLERSLGATIEGFYLNTVDVERLERVLEDDPFIENADVFVDAKNIVNVNIKQREPILRIIDNNGLNYYLDEDGNKMPLSKHFAARVLVATGNIPPHDPGFLERKRHLLKDVFLLANKIREDDFYNALFEQVHISNKGELTLIPKIGDQKIIFGTIDNTDEKLKNLKIFYQEGMPYEGWQKYRTIDVRFKGQVVCEKR